MYVLTRSKVDPNWIEIRYEDQVVQEIEIRFALRRFPKGFDSLEMALRWIAEMEKKLAKAKAFSLLSIRSYSRHSLFTKLSKRGFSETTCKELLLELVKLGYVEDEAYAERLIAREFNKGHGPRLIEMKLQAQGLSAHLVRSQIDEEMQRRKISELIKNYRVSDRKKAIQSLARKGFDLSLILQIAN